MSYQHGAFGSLSPSQDLSTKSAGTLPVYFGVLPIHQLADYSGKVNKPILVSSYNDAVEKVGYNDSNWTDYDLCEPIYAHFKNRIQSIGPIALVNVLDPDTMKTTDKTVSLTFTNNQAYIDSDKVILKSINIADKVLDVDYSVKYMEDGSKVLITDLKGQLTSPVTVTYAEVDLTKITKTEIIGGTDSSTGIKTGISVVDLVYQIFNIVPTILDSPGWSNDSDVDAALKLASQKINGHWYAFVNSNLLADASNNTIAKAKALKETDNFTGAQETPCWPMAKNGNRKFHLSTLTTVTMQMTDYNNNDIPYESPSNKEIDITGLCLDDGTDMVFDQVQANDLNSKGIKTAINWGGKWVLWGPHTGAYEYGADVDPSEIFDCSVRMLYYLLNNFQINYGNEIDKPMKRSRVDTILNNEQEQIDSYISEGKLLYGKVLFNSTSNPTSDMVNGDFVFDIATTTTPPGKSITAKVQYTTLGINVLLGGETA